MAKSKRTMRPPANRSANSTPSPARASIVLYRRGSEGAGEALGEAIVIAADAGIDLAADLFGKASNEKPAAPSAPVDAGVAGDTGDMAADPGGIDAGNGGHGGNGGNGGNGSGSGNGGNGDAVSLLPTILASSHWKLALASTASCAGI